MEPEALCAWLCTVGAGQVGALLYLAVFRARDRQFCSGSLARISGRLPGISGRLPEPAGRLSEPAGRLPKPT